MISTQPRSGQYIAFIFQSSPGNYISGGETDLHGTSGGWIRQYAQGIVAPSNATSLRIICISIATNAGTADYWRRIKVDFGPYSTPFSDESTYGAAYTDSTSMDSLRPAQIGANVTGTNQAASIAGQGSYATAQYAIPNIIINQPGNGYIYSDYVERSDGPALNTFLQYINGTAPGGLLSGSIFDARGLSINLNTGSAFIWGSTTTLSCPAMGQIAIAAATLSMLNGYKVSIATTTITGLSMATNYSVFYNLSSQTYTAVSTGSTSYYTSSSYLYVGSINTTAGQTGGGNSGGTTGGGNGTKGNIAQP